MHELPFTRAVPPRGMTMHVSRSPAFAQGIGRGTKPCHVSIGCLATAVKTRFRAPFGGFSRATSVPLRHRIPWAGSRFVTPRRPPMSDTIHRWHGGAGPSLPAWHPGLQRLTGAPGPFSAQRRTIFCTGPGMELCVVSPYQAPVPPRRIAMRCSRCGTR